MKIGRFMFGAVVSGLFALAAHAIYIEPPGALVVGRVVRAASIGGEGTGWMIVMAQPLQLASNRVTSIALDPGSVGPRWLAGRRVMVQGSVEYRTGVERGAYPVLVASSITPVRPFGPVPIPMSREELADDGR